MSAICGNCGDIIFVSNRPDWTTNKERPEISCDNKDCSNFVGRPVVWDV